MPTVEENIGEAITDIARRFDDDLFALTETELAARWYFKWNDDYTMTYNLYLFSDMLELHKRCCRRWEEHHNGSVCVVERVRDKYILPRVEQFMTEIAKKFTT